MAGCNVIDIIETRLACDDEGTSCLRCHLKSICFFHPNTYENFSVYLAEIETMIYSEGE